MLALYPRVADDTGTLTPWWPGPLMDQPAREYYAMCIIGAAWAEQHKADMDKASKGGGGG